MKNESPTILEDSDSHIMIGFGLTIMFGCAVSPMVSHCDLTTLLVTAVAGVWLTGVGIATKLYFHCSQTSFDEGCIKEKQTTSPSKEAASIIDLKEGHLSKCPATPSSLQETTSCKPKKKTQ